MGTKAKFAFGCSFYARRLHHIVDMAEVRRTSVPHSLCGGVFMDQIWGLLVDPYYSYTVLCDRCERRWHNWFAEGSYINGGPYDAVKAHKEQESLY